MQYLISSKTMSPERTKVASSTCADETLLIKHLLCRSDPLCIPAAYVQVSLRSVCQHGFGSKQRCLSQRHALNQCKSHLKATHQTVCLEDHHSSAVSQECTSTNSPETTLSSGSTVCKWMSRKMTLVVTQCLLQIAR